MNDNMSILTTCAKFYELCSGKDIDLTHFSLMDCDDWTIKDAVNSLEFDPSGYLAILLMRKAWFEFCEREVSIKDILSSDFVETMENIKSYNTYLTEGDASKVYENLLSGVKTLCDTFKITGYEETLKDDALLIDIFSSAFKNIYKDYRVDRFKCIDTKDNYPIICPKEVHVRTLQNFVDILRHSDNCIAYAKIDMVSEVDDPTEFDIFFAFGCRCDDYVYIVSDRDVIANPGSRASRLKRNPAKKLYNKAASSYMPYYDIQEKKSDGSKALVPINISYADRISEWKYINQSYDLYAQLTIVISAFALYNKYFVNHTKDVVYNGKRREYLSLEDSYFASEIKILPQSAENNTKELIVPESMTLPTPAFDKVSIIPDSMYFSDVDFYSKYIRRWCKPEDFAELPQLPDFVAPITKVKEWVWWLQRDKARQICNERMLKDYVQHFYSQQKFKQNRTKVPYEIKFKEGKSYGDLSLRGFNALEEAVPTSFAFCKDYDVYLDIGKHINQVVSYLFTQSADYAETKPKGSVADKLGLQEYFSKDADIFIRDYRRSSSDSTDWGRFINLYTRYPEDYYTVPTPKDCPFEIVVSMYVYYSDVNIYLKDGTKTKTEYTSFQIDSIDQLRLLFREDILHFPDWLQEWRYYATHMTPYCGNSLLDMTDPMERVFIPANYGLQFRINLYGSASDNKKIKKYLNLD